METTTDTRAKRLREGIRLLVRRFSLAERADISCCGMTVAQAATLEALSHGGLRLSDLGTRLGIAPSTLTRNLGRLEEKGLVARTSDPDDGRAQRVDLTKAGRAAAAEVGAQEEIFARSILDHLPAGTEDEALSTFETLLQAVRAATEDCCPGAYDHLVKPSSPCGGRHE
jgi:DNA-binding MarR family transcriptional regulator